MFERAHFKQLTQLLEILNAEYSLHSVKSVLLPYTFSFTFSFYRSGEKARRQSILCSATLAFVTAGSNRTSPEQLFGWFFINTLYGVLYYISILISLN